MQKEFEAHGIDKAVNDFFISQVEKDFQTIAIPKDVEMLLAKLMQFRDKDLKPETMDKMPVNTLISLQGEVMNYKYLIGRHLSVLKGAQSYAFIFRKFSTAQEYNKTKERLNEENGKRPTVGEIDSEIEKKIVAVRRSEVAFQVASDRIEQLLDWCNDVIMNIQNRIRQENTNQRTGFADNPGR